MQTLTGLVILLLFVAALTRVESGTFVRDTLLISEFS